MVVGVTMKFYQTTRVRATQQNNSINTDFFISECNPAEFDEMDDVKLDFINDVAPRNAKIDKRYYSDYAWLTSNYHTNYDFMKDHNQYLKKLLKHGPW